MIHYIFTVEALLKTDPFATKELLHVLLDFLDNKISMAEYAERFTKASHQLSLSSALYEGYAPTKH